MQLLYDELDDWLEVETDDCPESLLTDFDLISEEELVFSRIDESS